VENIAPKINELLEENDLVNVEKDNPPVWRNAFVLAYKDKLFWLYKRGSVATVDHFIAIGSGEYPAYPTLAKLDREEVCEDEKVNEALIKALQVASTRKTAVSAPFFLINTETQEFTIVR
jgi:20S proteasome alpha/beta subunit